MYPNQPQSFQSYGHWHDGTQMPRSRPFDMLWVVFTDFYGTHILAQIGFDIYWNQLAAEEFVYRWSCEQYGGLKSLSLDGMSPFNARMVVTQVALSVLELCSHQNRLYGLYIQGRFQYA